MTTWHEIRKPDTCPICDHAGWCGSATGEHGETLVRCMRAGGVDVPGARRIAMDQHGGTTYVLTGTEISPPTVRRQDRPIHRPSIDTDTLAELADAGEQAMAATPDAPRRLFTHLRASGHASPLHVLRRLRVGWLAAADLRAVGTACRADGCWSFPMTDADGTVIGIRLRAPDGGKYAVAGGANGLFRPADMQPGPVIHLPEGPTDVAALLELGRPAIGRPMARGCDDLVAQIATRFAHVIIWADRDRPQVRPDGVTITAPGLAGAMHLAGVLLDRVWRVSVAMPPEGVKDLRQLVGRREAARVLAACIDRAQHITSDTIAAWRTKHG